MGVTYEKLPTAPTKSSANKTYGGLELRDVILQNN
jgi:hypothetical protein